MKANNTRWIIFLMMSLFVVSCSNDIENQDDPVNVSGVTIPVNMELRNIPSNTTCDMYIFWKTTGSSDDYIYKDKEVLTTSPQGLHFNNSELLNKSYRFLFVIKDQTNPQIDIIDKNTGAWNESLQWNNVNIRANTQLLSQNNYWGVVDKTSQQIINEGTINGTLTRMVGQFIVDLFKIDGTMENPVDIINDGSVASVIDRVYRIEMQYAGTTRDMGFNAANELIPAAGWGALQTKAIDINITDGDLKVPIDGSIAELEYYPGNPAGNVRIKGLNLLPTDAISCKITFYYYDTTPSCENSHDTPHVRDCYPQKQLVLNLPPSGSSEVLTVKANHFTLNKGGIRYDRIIDLDAQGSYGFQTQWANEPPVN